MDKLQGIDLFLFKAYFEKTESFETGAVVLLSEILVNLPFGIVNLIVLFFSTIMKALEEFSVYEVYKKSVYDFSEGIWNRLAGSNAGVANNSILYSLITLAVVYLFIQWALSRGNFSQKVIHFLMVIFVSFAYFGTINATDGGLYILDGIRNFSTEVVKSLNEVSFEVVSGEKVDTSGKLSDDYIAKTSYQTYLYVNTGRVDGKVFNQQSEKFESFPNDKILGSSSGDGKFKEVSEEDRKNEADYWGDGASEGTQRNIWMSAVLDKVFIKLFYVLTSAIKAVVLPLPYLMVHLFRILSEILVLLLMIAFPIGIILSFVPRLQDLMFGFMKAFFVTGTFPAFATLVVLLCGVTEAFITHGLSSVFLSKLADNSTNLLVTNFISAVLSALIYLLFWKYKSTILSFFAGSYGSTVNQTINDGFQFAGSGYRNAQDMLNKLKNYQIEASPEEYTEVLDRTDNLHKEVVPEPEMVEQEDFVKSEFLERTVNMSDSQLDVNKAGVDVEELKLDTDLSKKERIDEIPQNPSLVTPVVENSVLEEKTEISVTDPADKVVMEADRVESDLSVERKSHDIYDFVEEQDVYVDKIVTPAIEPATTKEHVEDTVLENPSSAVSDVAIIEEIEDTQKGVLIEEMG
ncbi:hypothetical protein EII38_04580 [Streptococcus minor]|uniref:Uncharacterized protein n=1 Tax=Streptococcus minor TaxID=229549 RepID=A0A3P1VD08_9STRE|nr:hypothetical protein [Streptococcus minor]RRD31506.1 hypothetical protein EII38_04580 [Streptococcus minor]